MIFGWRYVWYTTNSTIEFLEYRILESCFFDLMRRIIQGITERPKMTSVKGYGWMGQWNLCTSVMVGCSKNVDKYGQVMEDWSTIQTFPWTSFLGRSLTNISYWKLRGLDVHCWREKRINISWPILDSLMRKNFKLFRSLDY